MPPEAALASVIDAPEHTLSKPVMGKARPTDTTLITLVAVSEPQRGVVDIYKMVSLPTVNPVKTFAVPDGTALAIVGFLLFHVPPETDAVSVIDCPVQTPDAPVIAPAPGNALTVTACDALNGPQLDEDVV